MSLTRKALTLRVIALLSAVTLLCGYVIFSQRAKVRRTRGTKSTQILEDLRQIDSAIDQYAIETAKPNDKPKPITDKNSEPDSKPTGSR